MLQTADTIIVTSPSTQPGVCCKDSKTHCTDYQWLCDTFTEEVSLSPYFLLSHIGSLLSERNPEPLWQVLGEMVRENEAFRKDLRICLAGKVSEEVFATIEK